MSELSLVEVVSKIDWAELRTQKNWLARMPGEEAEGLLSLLDALQDAAVREGIAAESEVFNLATEEGGTTQSTYLEGRYVCKHCGSGEVSFDQGVNDAYCAACGTWQNEAEETLPLEKRLGKALNDMVNAYTGNLLVPERKTALFNARQLLDEVTKAGH